MHTTLLSSRFDICWKIALGMQSYKLENVTEIICTYPYSYSRKVSGSMYTTMLGLEINHRTWKVISLGAKTSLIPGNYKKLETEGSEYTSTDNVSRLNAGLKITVTL